MPPLIVSRDFPLHTNTRAWTDFLCPEFSDGSDTEGTCASKKDGSAFEVYSCSFGTGIDKKYTQSVYLKCVVEGNARYCNESLMWQNFLSSLFLRFGKID